MKTVLENVSSPPRFVDSSADTRPQPEPIKNINELAKAQLMYFSAAAESLSQVQGDLEELSVAAEGEYR
jgi:hypothetical protein